MSQKAFFAHADSLGLWRGAHRYHTGFVRVPDPQNTEYQIVGFEYDPQGYHHKVGWVNVSWYCNDTSYHSSMKLERFLNLKRDDIEAIVSMVEQTDKAWRAAQVSGKTLKTSIHEIIKGEVQL